jgi:SAM-dependent methyltransferase
MPRMAKQRVRTVDAQGALFWDFYNGKPFAEIAERDDGHIAAGRGPRAGPDAYFSDYEDWSPKQKAAIRYAQGRILDIGCGAGRHSLHLQKMGHEVTGIDASPLAIKICKLRGHKNARLLPIGGIGEFAGESFDTVILLGNNFGLFGSFRKAQSLLKILHRITSKDARIIAETMDPHATTDPDHLAYHKQNLKRGRMAGQTRLRIRHRKLTGPWFDYLFVSEPELQMILKDTGWMVHKILRSRKPPSFQYVAILSKS